MSLKQKEDFIKDIKRIRKVYEETTNKLIKIIKEMTYINGINKIGIFYFNGYTTSDEVNIKLEKEKYSIEKIDMEYIMKIKENVIVYFV